MVWHRKMKMIQFELNELESHRYNPDLTILIYVSVSLFSNFDFNVILLLFLISLFMVTFHKIPRLSRPIFINSTCALSPRTSQKWYFIVYYCDNMRFLQLWRLPCTAVPFHHRFLYSEKHAYCQPSNVDLSIDRSILLFQQYLCNAQFSVKLKFIQDQF